MEVSGNLKLVTFRCYNQATEGLFFAIDLLPMHMKYTRLYETIEVIFPNTAFEYHTFPLHVSLILLKA